MPEQLQLVIRTPHAVLVDQSVRAARVPTETGQVGLRPHQEPFVLVVQPGLCIMMREQGMGFVATAGGLLDADRKVSVLYTPFAVAGDRGDEVLAALERVLATPDSELLARRRLAELEQQIARQFRSKAPGTPRSEGHA